jgi:hypothetical protein
MRELTVRLMFLAPCLGNVRKYRRQKGKVQHYYVFPRHPVSDRVMFLPKWWAASLRRAAQVLCKHQREVQEILFTPEIDGNPAPIPEQFYRRHLRSDQYTKHEAYFPGAVIGITCAVPDSIDDDDFVRLMQYAGKYSGISRLNQGSLAFMKCFLYGDRRLQLFTPRR